MYKNGAVEKTSLCYCIGSRNLIINATGASITNESSSKDVSPKEVIKIVRSALKSVQKSAKDLYNRGFPANQAIDSAIRQELDEWKERVQ